MNARDEITHLINQYSFTIDGGNLNGFASLFESGEWRIEGVCNFIGKQEVFDYLQANVTIYEDGTPRTRHLTTNIDLHIDEDEGKASSQCYITVMQQTDDFPLQAIFSGHYFDEFECVSGQWRFVTRTVKSPLMGDMSRHVKLS